MSYIDGLTSTLDQISQIQGTFSALGSAPTAGGFEAVMQQMSQISGLSGSSSTSAGGGGALGAPLEEGMTLPGTGTAPALTEGTPTASATASAGAPGLGSTGALGLAGPYATASGPESAGSLEASGEQPAGDLGAQAVTQAEKYLGVPYQWGGTNPAQGVDCSGLVQDVYGSLGITLPRTSEEQATVGQAVPSMAQAEPGDLVFFPGSDGTAASPGHVGIYIGNGQMIDAPHTGADVRVDQVGTPTEIRRVSTLAGPAPGATGTAGATAYATDFAGAASSYGVPEQLLAAVASTESSFQPAAVSSAGAEGLMQLMPTTAASLGVDPFDPSQAIGGAAKLLSSYHAQYGSWSLALAAYNAGPGAVEQYGGVPPYGQTQAYVQNVLAKSGLEGQ